MSCLVGIMKFSHKHKLAVSFWVAKFVSWFNDSLGFQKGNFFGLWGASWWKKEAILLWFIPHIYIRTYIHQVHTYTSKVMNKTWKKSRSTRFVNGKPKTQREHAAAVQWRNTSFITQFVNNPLTFFIHSGQCLNKWMVKLAKLSCQ